MVFFHAVLLMIQQTPVTLESLEADTKTFSSEKGFFADPKPARAINNGLLILVSDDKLGTGNDFYRAARLTNVLNWDYEDARLKYELELTALALGEQSTLPFLPQDWDTLQLSLGRKQRLGSMSMPPEFDSEVFAKDLAPKCVIDVLTAKARMPKSKPDNVTMQRIVDADQKDREGDWMSHSDAEFAAIMKRDKKRLADTRSIIQKDQLSTPQDFFNAALVMQHGEVARDFALAHELCLCSIVLGDTKNSRWLAAASYDRMLRHCGQRQRFATQYDNEGLQKFDVNGINDRMRAALKCPSLEEAKKRVPGQ